MKVRHWIISLSVFMATTAGSLFAADQTPVKDQDEEAGFRFSLVDVEGFADGKISGKKYEDPNIRIEWSLAAKPAEIDFMLYNRSQRSIMVVWDEAAYVGIDGQTQKTMHKGVRYISRNEAQPPSVVIKNASLSDLLIPTDHVLDGSSDWSALPLFDADPKSKEDVETIRSKYKGKSFRILLPLRIESKTVEYVFTFRIDDFVCRQFEDVSLPGVNTSESQGDTTTVVAQNVQNLKIVLEAEFTAKTYIELYLDGAEKVRGVMQAGKRQCWEATDLIQIKIGNAGGVKARINGKDYSFGLPGQVANKVVTWKKDPAQNRFEIVVRDWY